MADKTETIVDLKKADSSKASEDPTDDYSIHKKIIILEIVSILFAVSSCVFNGFLWFNESNTTALAVLTDGFLNTITYSFVIWCYFRKRHIHSKLRDQTSQIMISIIFLVSSTLIKFIAMKNILFKFQLNWNINYIFINLGQSLIFSVLSIFKFFLSTKFKYSSTLHASGVNAFMSGLSSFSIALSMIFLMFGSKIWYFDSLIGIFISFILNIYGSILLMSNFCK